MTKAIITVLAIEVAIVGLVLSSGAYAHHRYYQGYADGLLDGASESLTMSENKN